MFSRKVLFAALWVAATTAFPALGLVDPIVKPIIDRVPDKAPDKPVFVTPNTPAPNVPSPIKADVGKAKRYDDGKVYRGAVVDRPCSCGCGKSVCTCDGFCTAQPVRSNVGWWQRGPARRWISGFRLFRWRRGR